jgi:hypothetical protein
VDPVGTAKNGEVEVVVDDEEGAGGGGHFPEPASQVEQLATCEGLVPKLDHVSAPA